CRFHGLVLLEPHQVVYTVLVRETRHQVALVLPDALDEIRSDADVERSVPTAGEDVDAGLSHCTSTMAVPGADCASQTMAATRQTMSPYLSSRRKPGSRFCPNAN